MLLLNCTLSSLPETKSSLPNLLASFSSELSQNFNFFRKEFNDYFFTLKIWQNSKFYAWFWHKKLQYRGFTFYDAQSPQWRLFFTEILSLEPCFGLECLQIIGVNFCEHCLQLGQRQNNLVLIPNDLWGLQLWVYYSLESDKVDQMATNSYF